MPRKNYTLDSSETNENVLHESDSIDVIHPHHCFPSVNVYQIYRNVWCRPSSLQVSRAWDFRKSSIDRRHTYICVLCVHATAARSTVYVYRMHYARARHSYLLDGMRHATHERHAQSNFWFRWNLWHHRIKPCSKKIFARFHVGFILVCAQSHTKHIHCFFFVKTNWRLFSSIFYICQFDSAMKHENMFNVYQWDWNVSDSVKEYHVVWLLWFLKQ